MKQQKVLAYANLPSQGKLLILGLIYGIYSKIYGFPLLLDGAIAALLFIGLVAEIIIFLHRKPVDIFNDSFFKDHESE